jgi:hypothetical protein
MPSMTADEYDETATDVARLAGAVATGIPSQVLDVVTGLTPERKRRVDAQIGLRAAELRLRANEMRRLEEKAAEGGPYRGLSL